MTKTRKILLIILSVVVLLTAGILIREKMLRRAEKTHGGYEFDGKQYEIIDFKEIEPYKETWSTVCKTADGVWTIYEIEEYPELDYVVARTSWQAEVLKRVSDTGVVKE